MRSALVCGVGALFALSMGCGGGGGGDDGGVGPGPGPGPGPGTGNEGAAANAIDVRDNSFSPSSTTVVPGTTVTWTWRGSQDHDVAFDDGTHSDRQRAGTYARTFPTAGTFAYHCNVHGASMSGSVVVR